MAAVVVAVVVAQTAAAALAAVGLAELPALRLPVLLTLAAARAETQIAQAAQTAVLVLLFCGLLIH